MRMSLSSKSKSKAMAGTATTTVVIAAISAASTQTLTTRLIISATSFALRGVGFVGLTLPCMASTVMTMAVAGADVYRTFVPYIPRLCALFMRCREEVFSASQGNEKEGQDCAPALL